MNAQAKSTQINTIQALNWALDDAMTADDNVVIFGEEIADPEGGGIMQVSAGLSTKYGARVRSTPISEMGFTGVAVGAAIVGIRPLIEIMLMNFVAVCMDQITNHAAKLRFMSGGCFTLSSLGSIGGTGFTPIINAPELAIMGVTRAFQKPVNVGGGLQWRTMLPLSLSYDHRVINGADAARFCVTFAGVLSEFARHPTQS